MNIEENFEINKNEIENTGISVRQGNDSDIERCVEICNAAWGGIFEGNKKMLEDRHKTFPEGFMVGEVDGNVEGYLSFQLIDDVYSFENWDKATDYGHMKESHNPNGEWIMGVGMAVTKKGVANKITPKIIDLGVKYMEQNNKKGCYFAIRIPGFKKYEEEFNNNPIEKNQEKDLVKNYLLIRKNNKSIDPEVRLWGMYGFSLTEPPVIFENYVEGGGDPKSKGYAVLIKRLNPKYKKI